MKELTTYINEKLDLNKVNLHDKFPIDEDSKKIIEFLSFLYTLVLDIKLFDKS